jgi:hypothetical protein
MIEVADSLFCVPSIRGDFPGGRSILYHSYRAPGFAHNSSSDSLPARSCFPSVSGQLLPEKTEENSRARTGKVPSTSGKIQNPVRVVEQHFGEFFTLAVCRKYFLLKVNV